MTQAFFDTIHEVHRSNKVNIAKIYASERVYIPEALQFVLFHYQLLSKLPKSECIMHEMDNDKVNRCITCHEQKRLSRDTTPSLNDPSQHVCNRCRIALRCYA